MARSQGPLPYLTDTVMGNLAGTEQKGLASPIGKSRSMQNLGNITGRRGAGIARYGGSQMRHAFNHYGKQPDWKAEPTDDSGDSGTMF